MQVELIQIVIVLACHFRVLWVVWHGSAEQRLQRDQGCSNCQGGSPLVFQNVETDCTSLTADVGMPNFSIELHLRKCYHAQALLWVVWMGIQLGFQCQWWRFLPRNRCLSKANVKIRFGVQISYRAENRAFPVPQVVSHDLRWHLSLFVLRLIKGF